MDVYKLLIVSNWMVFGIILILIGVFNEILLLILIFIVGFVVSEIFLLGICLIFWVILF